MGGNFVTARSSRPDPESFRTLSGAPGSAARSALEPAGLDSVLDELLA
jgi:hypothetical protein